MAPKKRRPAKKTRKKKAATFRIELGWPGIAGIGVVIFCLFLWMFLIGIWAGQTILLPPGKQKSTSSTVATITDKAKVRVQKEQVQHQPEPPQPPRERAVDIIRPRAVKKRMGQRVGSAQKGQNQALLPKPGKEKVKHYFTIQVGAYRDGALARRTAADLKKKYGKVFLIPALEGNDALLRVCVGKFETQEEAVAQARKISLPQGKKPFVTHFPATRFR